MRLLVRGNFLRLGEGNGDPLRVTRDDVQGLVEAVFRAIEGAHRVEDGGAEGTDSGYLAGHTVRVNREVDERGVVDREGKGRALGSRDGVAYLVGPLNCESGLLVSHQIHLVVYLSCVAACGPGGVGNTILWKRGPYRSKAENEAVSPKTMDLGLQDQRDVTEVDLDRARLLFSGRATWPYALRIPA